MKFLFIRAEVIPMVMQFRRMGPIPKEEMKVPHGVAWYENLMALPNRVFGEQVLVAAGMSDKWPEDSKSVPVLLLDGEGVLRNLGVDPEEKKPKRASKKKTTAAGGVAVKKTEVASATSDAASQKGTPQFRQSRLEDFVYVADSFEELYAIGGKPPGSVAVGARSSGSAGSKGPESGATPTSAHAEEAEEESDPEKLIRKNASKRSREETKSEASPDAKKIAGSKPVIGKKRSLRTLYTEVSPGKYSYTCFFLLPFPFVC
ncbi:hypothetical protein HanRHA438_Chr01g0033961 [Helianthus annuus]|uniref:Uncharacterized protein n=1 Tax=Helianthus annuus TaxID=4232 RepID=A0A9K3JWX2_HELAN|nr:hypothetical protein HanXRQr2_Chr01g0033171 [Helianthus annuus]KAJ0627735.1 hypothetical protein HanHA89_Chr01g0029091 [Helianthus annuus]KAJ0784028.1 hypothetical protein HanLR1_Chr01g0027601 [Helianthus annuus]KAJ0949004.1 hypothetical protein HanRHA438_Chr01g0033961 [Helianthus annuus]